MLPKLGTFDGVFLPTSLNVLSILMFLRFGFILGQAGVLGSLLLLVLSYAINILTTLSISAIATNGTVRGGGAYYMISRSLGPEFGGAIGIIFFVGQILNASLNVLGFIEPLLVNFGNKSGFIAHWLPELLASQLWYSTILLAACTAVAIVGSKLVSKTAFCLFIILCISTLSIPVSTMIVKPFNPLPSPYEHLRYSGPSLQTLQDNWWPHLTSGAAGSGQPPGIPETFRNLFGIFFPSTAGIFAGASMSGELKTPSRSIPKGTLYGLLVSFILYALVIVAMGVSIPRPLLYADIEIIQTVNLHEFLIIAGEFSTALFSVIMGVVGAASLLNAIADDKILPGLSVFVTHRKSGPQLARAQLFSILATWLLAQIFLLADVNSIANLITMAFLMTFIVTNIACFLLRIGLAPNFRPSFKYFNSKTAFVGASVLVVAMFIVDGISATLVIALLLLLIILIHYLTPPSKFGDISQLLIYHQVRKYLLRLKVDMSVKYWRPQILLLCDDPQTSWNLIGFCNHLKKGGLYVLGHVIVANGEPGTGDDMGNDFSIKVYNEIRRQKQAWTKLRDMSKIKAFVHIAIGPSLPWGVRNVYLGSGLGGMKPNITVLGFYDFNKVRTFKGDGPNLELPTDALRKERKVSVAQWVQIVEDLVILQATVAVAANFTSMKIPDKVSRHWWPHPPAEAPLDTPQRKFIDLYPIQMSSHSTLDDGKSILSTNFDTYTLILQLGAILKTVPEWHATHQLRVIAFVELASEIGDERKRLQQLLSTLRFEASIIVISLEDQNLAFYNFIVKGIPSLAAQVDLILSSEQWWKNLRHTRETLLGLKCQPSRPKAFQSLKLTRPIDTSKSLGHGRRCTLSNLHERGLSLLLNMRTQSHFAQDDSASELSENEESEGTTADLLPSPSLSVRQSRQNLMPNFLSIKIPESHVNSEEEDADDIETTTTTTNKSSIHFVLDLDTGPQKQSSLDLRQPKVRSEVIKNLENGRSQSRPSSIFSNHEEIIHRLKSPKLFEDEPLMDTRFNALLPQPTTVGCDATTTITSDPGISRKHLQNEVDTLTFNDIPARGQHLILNELMKLLLPSHRTSIIFSTLPAPPIGTHLDEDELYEYTKSIALWLNDLAPVLLVNSQTVTVTTAL